MRRVWSTSDPCVFGVGAEKRPAYCDVRSAGIVTLCCPRLCVHLPRARIFLFIVGPIPVNIYRVPSSLPPFATENGNLYQAGKFIKRDVFFLFSLFIGQGWRKMKYGWRRRFGVFLLEIEEDQSVIDKTWDERIVETKFERGKFENFLRIVIRS